MERESLFLSRLGHEHKAILNVINHFKKVILNFESNTFDDKTLKKCQSVFKFLHLILEKVHHGKEEKILFPWILKNGLANQGGPQCGLFMQYRVEWKTSETLIQMCKNLLGDTSLPQPSFAVRQMLQQNSFIGIPLEEHQAGACALFLFEEIFLNKKITPTLAELKKIVLHYSDLMEMHVRKEDECMFVMVQENMTQEDDSFFCQTSNELETQYGLDLIRENLSWGMGLK